MASAMPRQLSVSAAWANAYPRLPVEEMVRRVGVGFVRLEQALQRPVVHGRRGEPARGRGVRAEPVGQCQSRGYGVDLGGGQVLAEQSRRLYVVGGAVVVDADDDADAMAVLPSRGRTLRSLPCRPL